MSEKLAKWWKRYLRLSRTARVFVFFYVIFVTVIWVASGSFLAGLFAAVLVAGIFTWLVDSVIEGIDAAALPYHPEEAPAQSTKPTEDPGERPMWS